MVFRIQACCVKMGLVLLHPGELMLMVRPGVIINLFGE
jgi:hypothetical protein